jgi:hypothetical protein
VRRALSLTAIVVACGFGLQWIALPRAGRGDVVAARAAQWLDRYREARSELFVDGRTLHARCFRGWIDGPHGRDVRGTLLAVDNGWTIRDVPPHTLLQRGPLLAHPVATLEAAGCTRVLASRLAQLAQFDGGVSARRLRLDGRAALAVDFPHLTLYVDRRSDIPIGISADHVRSRIRLVPVLPSRTPPS